MWVWVGEAAGAKGRNGMGEDEGGNGGVGVGLVHGGKYKLKLLTEWLTNQQIRNRSHFIFEQFCVCLCIRSMKSKSEIAALWGQMIPNSSKFSNINR